MFLQIGSFRLVPRTSNAWLDLYRNMLPTEHPRGYRCPTTPEGQYFTIHLAEGCTPLSREELLENLDD